MGYWRELFRDICGLIVDIRPATTPIVYNPDESDNEPFQPESQRISRSQFIRGGTPCIKALSGMDKAVKLDFNNMAVHMPLTERPVSAGNDSALLPYAVDLDKALWRKRARADLDTIAAWQAHHNQKDYEHAMPRDGKAQRIYTMLEKARCDALLCRTYEGVSANMEAVRVSYANSWYQCYFPEEHVFGATYLLVSSIFEDKPLPPLVADFIQKFSPVIERLPMHDLRALAAVLEDRGEFLWRASVLAKTIAPFFNIDEKPLRQSKAALDPLPRSLPRSECPFDDEKVLPVPDQDARNSTYRIYTTEFDKIVFADKMATPEVLAGLRRKLDAEMLPYRKEAGKLANRLQRRLQSIQQRAWMFDMEEGILDTARLSRIVTDRTNPLSFKQERDAPFNDTVVQILIDNSYSTSAKKKNVVIAMTVDMLALALERAGIKVEILGYTTGKVRENEQGQRVDKPTRAQIKWEMEKKPNPGRVDDLVHIIYKTPEQPIRRVRNNLGLILHKPIMGPNVDGEALQWGLGRLMARPEQRKIMIVLSDGAPGSEITEQLNVEKKMLIVNHLKKVALHIEEKTPVELVAIGILSDPTPFYKNATILYDPKELGAVLAGKLETLFPDPARPVRRPHRSPAPR